MQVMTTYDQNSDYYVVLGVNPTADTDAIDRAFRKMSLIHHPDKPTGDPQTFQFINNIHHVLKDPALRREYDSNRSNNGSTVAKSIALYPGQFFLVESHPIISVTKKSQLILRHERRISFHEINLAKAKESLASAKYTRSVLLPLPLVPHGPILLHF